MEVRKSFLYGHAALGLSYVFIGLWHLYNHIKIHATRKPFKSLQWFPTPYLRYLEPYVIIFSCSIFNLTELNLAHLGHNEPTFKANHLPHFQHVCMATAFILHAVVAILLDKFGTKPGSDIDMGHLFMSLAFALELLVFHFHTVDGIDLEWQYHWLLQQLILVCLIFSLLSIWLPKSFMVCYIRSLAAMFQGLWLIVTGYMLFTPEFVPKGCALHTDGYVGRPVITCDDQHSLHRGKALIIISFSCVFIGIMCFGVCFYWVVNKVYEVNEFTEVDLEGEDCQIEDRQGFLHSERVLPFDLEQ